jgi:hypothetical protein
VKKNRAKPAKRRDDERSDALRKQDSACARQPVGDSLTCNEAQVEDLLSEGEST